MTAKPYVLKMTRSTYKCLTCGAHITNKRKAYKHVCKPKEVKS